MSARREVAVDEARGSRRHSHGHRDGHADRDGESGRVSQRHTARLSQRESRDGRPVHSSHLASNDSRRDGKPSSRKRARSDSASRRHRRRGRPHGASASASSSDSSHPSLDSDGSHGSPSSRSRSRSRSRSVSPSSPAERRRHRRSERAAGRPLARRPHAADDVASAAATASVAGAASAAVIQSAAALAGYTDADNPFNDQHITQPFTWHKKNQQQQQQQQQRRHRDRQQHSPSAAALQARQAALVAEVAEVKQRRLAREEERRAMDAVKEQMERERAAEQVAGWEEKEEDFHRQQARRRTKIRVQERRERAVDLLMKNVAFERWLAEDEDEERIKRQRERMVAGAAAAALDATAASPTSLPGAHNSPSTRSSLLREAQLTNPVSLLSALPLSDLLELRGELVQLLQLQEHTEYWGAIATLCDDEIERCKGERPHSAGVAPDVLRGIQAMMADKSASELRTIGEQVHSALEDGLDLPYWRAVSRQLEVRQAKAALRDAHSDMIRRRLELLNDERRRREAQQQPARQQRQPGDDEQAAALAGGGGGGKEGSGTDSGLTNSSRATMVVATRSAPQLADDGGVPPSGDDSHSDHHLSPRLFSFDEQLDVPVIEAAEDQRAIAQQRAAVLATYQPHTTTLAQLHPSAAPRSADPGGPSSEYAISNEVSLPAASPSSSLPWSSKWRPRKPRYFNRVKTGFDWNKYNQVHYDKDNPPPKLVQGYKFNVFYPDLVDPGRTPTYRLQPLQGDEQGAYCILRFEAGPPYEDVAFKIVRKEWEFGPRRGFRCSFDKGVLQLHFNFKRYFYRR